MDWEVLFMSCLATFKTTSMALMFERACRGAGIAARIAPVPRKLSSSCGLACEFPCEEQKTVESLARDHRIDVSSYHDMNTLSD